MKGREFLLRINWTKQRQEGHYHGPFQGDGEVAQWLKLEFGFPTAHKSQAPVILVGDEDRRISEIHCPVSPAESVSIRCNERPCLKK